MRNDDKDTKYIFHRGLTSILLLFCHEDSKKLVTNKMSNFKFSQGSFFDVGLQNVGVLYRIITRSKEYVVKKNNVMSSRQDSRT